MCKWSKYGDTRIDPCMKKVIGNLNNFLFNTGYKTLACCCGHGKYPMSIIVDIGLNRVVPVEIFSGLHIPRKKKFYKRDKQGHYYIPEVINYEKTTTKVRRKRER